MQQQNLPKWVWDLVMHLQQQEEEHPKLFRQVDTKYLEQGYSYQEAEWCPGRALDLVPAEAKAAAKGIQTYLRLTDPDKQEGDGDVAGR